MNTSPKRPGLRACINQHCKDCIYDDKAPGSWVKQVHRCTVTQCALYPIRPRSAAAEFNKEPAQ